MTTVKCEYTETNKITSEIIVSHILGTFTGITVKERFINENVSFTDVFLSINCKEYNISDLSNISFYEYTDTDFLLCQYPSALCKDESMFSF
jgi:hypothetical protein